MWQPKRGDKFLESAYVMKTNGRLDTRSLRKVKINFVFLTEREEQEYSKSGVPNPERVLALQIYKSFIYIIFYLHIIPVFMTDKGGQ